ncbi:MAG: ABC transporter ATP-binding protein [Lentisphaerae bacterium]|nr:ABC transporter ATP-binding protein [Lentisphaerota bacterium]
MALLDVHDLTMRFHTRDGVVRAVEAVSFQVDRGETLGLVGESGSGKSVTCMALLGLVPTPPGRLEAGRADFDGTDLLSCGERRLRDLRGRRIGMIFQDPMTALNPCLRIGTQMAEVLRCHGRCSRREALDRAEAALRDVGIQDAAERARGYPHQLSGGMRQRVMIAMALMAGPDLLIADEPTTALDVTVQAQILELMRGLQQARGMAMILVTHNLGVVAGACDRVAVMYAGRIVETGPVEAVFRQPLHPYTEALYRALPRLALEPRRDLEAIPGQPPRITAPEPGCPFAPRCRHAAPVCREPMALRELSAGHATACLRRQRGEL